MRDKLIGIAGIGAHLPERFVPLAITMRIQAPGGAAIQVTTVRLVPRSAE